MLYLGSLHVEKFLELTFNYAVNKFIYILCTETQQGISMWEYEKEKIRNYDFAFFQTVHFLVFFQNYFT